METVYRHQLGKQSWETIIQSFTQLKHIGLLADHSHGERTNPNLKAHRGTYFGHMVCISGVRVVHLSDTRQFSS